MGSIHSVLFYLLKPLNFNVFSWILQVLCFQIFCIFHTFKPFDAMILTFVTETISRTDQGQPRPKYIFNKYGTNIYFFTLQRFGPSPSPNFKSPIIIGSIISFHAILFHFFQWSDQYVFHIPKILWGIWDFSIIEDSGRRWFIVLKRTPPCLGPPSLKKNGLLFNRKHTLYINRFKFSIKPLKRDLYKVQRRDELHSDILKTEWFPLKGVQLRT